ncbi:MAG TPA: rod shape-determining protein MreC [candidate division Zixibacteria bacterium]|nr:rod shape-determining protein MreC [candidate division Zixibacteria bacterium]
MLALLRKYQIPVASCACLLLSLYILTAASRGQLKSDPVGPLLLWLMRPLQVAAQAASGWVKGLHEAYWTTAGLRAENERLKKRIAQLEIERNRLLEAEATNQRLRQLLEFKASLPASGVVASIIANSASSWFQSCLINRGSADGVRKGMAVVTPLGVVGRVVDVSRRTAKVLLLTDANSGVDVFVQRSRARGIVAGSLENGTIMKYVKRSEDVQEGDRLVTSGLDGIFPKGLMVGVVTKVRKQSLGLFQSIEVAPAVRPERTEEVIVVGSELRELAG